MSAHDRPETAPPSPASTLVPPAARAHRGRSAVLLDLENLLFDQSRVDAMPQAVGDDGTVYSMPLNPWVDNDRAAVLLDAIRRDAIADLGRPGDYWLAVATADLIRQVYPLLDAAGIRYRTVPNTPNAADEYLLDIAEHLACVQDPFTDFVIGSGDHIFTDFVSSHAATVLVRGHGSLSRDLRMAAKRIHLLDVEVD